MAGFALLKRPMLVVSLGVCAFASVGAAQAQVSQSVDQSMLETWRLNTGSSVRLCQFTGVPTAEFDRSIGEAIADRLLLDSEYTELGAGYGIGGEFAGQDLYVSLVNDCDIILGMGLGPNLYPQEFTPTRPYVGFSYVGVAADPELQRLADIPADRRLGARVASFGYTATMRYAATLPQDQRWQILPYGDIDLMVTRLVDETIGGMIIYGPSLAAVLADQPDLDLNQFPLSPEISANVEVGGIMLTSNSYLRTLVDDAIASMIEDGTIEELVVEAGLDNIPFSVGGF